MHKNDRKFHEEKKSRAREAQQAALLESARKGDMQSVMQYIMNEKNPVNHVLLHACLKFKNLSEAQFLTVLRWDTKAAETARSAIEESADALGQLEVTLPHARRAGGGVGALSASESGAPALVVLRGLARVAGRPARASFACGHPRGCTTCHQRGRVKLAALSPLEPDARQNTSHGRKQKLALASFLAHTQGFDLGTGGNFNGSRARFVPTRQRREPTHRNKTPNKVGRKFPTTCATSGLRPVGTATPPKGVQARMC